MRSEASSESDERKRRAKRAAKKDWFLRHHFAPFSLCAVFGARYSFTPHHALSTEPHVDARSARCSTDLVQTSQDVILCKKKGCLRLDLINDGINLSHLRGNLANVFAKHAEESEGCGGKLKFQVDNTFGVSVLMCSCGVCGGEFVAL